MGSGVHRLFEGQVQKEGHFSTRFGSQEGTLASVLAPQEGSLSCFEQPRGQFSVYCQPRGHFGTLFWLPGGHFSARFGSQEGTLAHVFQQLGHCPPLCTSLLTGVNLNFVTPQVHKEAVDLLKKLGWSCCTYWVESDPFGDCCTFLITPNTPINRKCLAF